MAKPRVVVEGLKGAIQQVRPTVPSSYGTTPVNVIQTPSWQDTQLGQLARVLGVGVQIAGEVKQIGDIKEQEAISELADKSIEELNAEALQNKKEFDKGVRKQFIPFMSNPWNQERVRKAAGAQYHDEFQLRLQQALDKSDAATPTDKVVQDVITGMTEDYESLKDITIRQGFDAATKGTIQQYSLRYNSIKNEQNENELFRGGRSVLFNASTLVNGEIADPEAITNWWEENEGALKPAKLAELRKSVILLHASRGNFEAAREFQEYTSKFKAGTTKMGDPDIKEDDVFGMYSAEEAALRQTIDDMELKSDERLVAGAQNELRIFDELANDIGRAIRNKEGYKVDAQTIIKTAEQAENYLLEELQKSKNIIVRGSKGRSLVQNALKAYEVESNDENRYLNFGNKYSQVELNRGPNSFRFGYESALDNFKREYSTVDKFTNKIIFDPRFQKLSNDLLAEMTRKRANKMQELSSGRFTDVEGNTVVVSKFEDQIHYMKDWDNLYLQEFNQKLKEQGDILQPKIKLTNESKIKTSDIKDEDVKSFVNPDQALSDATTYWFTPDHNFADLEDSLRAGEVGEINSALKDLEEKKVPQISELIEAFPVYPKKLSAVDRALNTLNSAKSSEADIQESKRMLSIYALAKGKYNTESIRNGFIEIEGKEIKIDKESLKDLVDIYPLIPKERLIDISETEPEEFPEEQALFEAIYDVELEETEEDEQLLIKFIEKQARLSEKIHKS